MKKLLVTYADESTEIVPSELTPAQYLDSRFGTLPEDTKVKVEKYKEPKAAAEPKD